MNYDNIELSIYMLYVTETKSIQNHSTVTYVTMAPFCFASHVAEPYNLLIANSLMVQNLKELTNICLR